MKKSDTIHSVRNGNLLYRKYREFFIPTILAGVASSMSIIIDSILVGNMLGPNEMASVNLCMPVMQFFYMISVLIGMGASTLIAIQLGKRNRSMANRYFNLSFILVCLIGFLLTLGGAFSVDYLARFIASDDSLLPLVKSYLIPLLWGNWVIILLPASVYVLRTDGFVRLASSVLVVANLFNLLLDVLFMGPLQMGILGSSLATVCGYTIGAGVLATYVFSTHRSLSFELNAALFHQCVRRVKEMMITGLPAAVGIGLVALKLFFMNHLVGDIAGSEGLVVFSVCISCLSFMSMFISGTAGTMMPIVGTLYGERDFRGIYFIMRYALRFSLVVSGVVLLLFEIFSAAVFALFGVDSNAQILAMGIVGLRMFAVSLVGVSISFLMMYYFLTIRESLFANVISVTEGLLFPVPLAWIFSRFLGLEGVWTGYIVTELFAILTIFLMIRYRKAQKKNEQLNLLLIQNMAPEVICEATVSIDKSVNEPVAREVLDRLLHVYPDFQQKELFVSLVQHVADQIHQLLKSNRQVWMDIRILNQDQTISVLFRNDGVLYDPTRKLLTDYADLAGRVHYSSVLALNQLQVDLVK